jgi:hypothetical protein
MKEMTKRCAATFNMRKIGPPRFDVVYHFFIKLFSVLGNTIHNQSSNVAVGTYWGQTFTISPGNNGRNGSAYSPASSRSTNLTTARNPSLASHSGSDFTDPLSIGSNPNGNGRGEEIAPITIGRTEFKVTIPMTGPLGTRAGLSSVIAMGARRC